MAKNNKQDNGGNNNGNHSRKNNGNNKNNNNTGNRGQNNNNNNSNNSNSNNNGRKTNGANPDHGKTCDNCLKQNHTSADCRLPCGNCGGKDGHKRKRCRVQVQNGNGNGAARVVATRSSNNTSKYCKYCNRLNHDSEDCTNAQTKRRYESSHVTCTKCTLKGHDSDACINPQYPEPSVSQTVPLFGPKPVSAVIADNDSWFQQQYYNKLEQLVNPEKALVCERCELHQVPTDRSNHLTESCPIYSYCVYCNICDMPYHNTHTCPSHQSKKAYEQSQLYCYGCGHNGHVYMQDNVVVCKHPNPGEDMAEINVPMNIIKLYDRQVEICGEEARKAESPNPTHKRMLDRLQNHNCHYLAVPRMAELAGKDFRLHCGSCNLEAMVVCNDQDIVMGDCDQYVPSVVPLKAADMCLEIGCDHWGYIPNERALYWKKSAEN